MALPPGGRKPRITWTPAFQERFIEALADCGVIRTAAKAVGTTFQTIHRRIARDKDFADQVESAKREFADTLEQEAIRRAVEGVEEPVFFKGQQVVYIDRDGNEQRFVRKYSDKLLMQQLNAWHPDKYKWRQDIQHSMDGDLGKVLDRLSARGKETPKVMGDSPAKDGTNDGPKPTVTDGDGSE